jgi:hypothetical protein
MTEFAAMATASEIVDSKRASPRTAPALKPASERHLMVRQPALDLADDLVRAFGRSRVA